MLAAGAMTGFAPTLLQGGPGVLEEELAHPGARKIGVLDLMTGLTYRAPKVCGPGNSGWWFSLNRGKHYQGGQDQQAQGQEQAEQPFPMHHISFPLRTAKSTPQLCYGVL